MWKYKKTSVCKEKVELFIAGVVVVVAMYMCYKPWVTGCKRCLCKDMEPVPALEGTRK